MTSLPIKDGNNVLKYLSIEGSGTENDPYQRTDKVVELLGLKSLGPASMAESLPVVVASDHAAIAVGGAAADDAAADGNPLPIGGLYQNPVDLVDSGDIGRIRMSARRALYHAADYSLFSLYGTTPNPAGCDIVTSVGGAPVTGDFHVRDTAWHGLMIPMAAAGWRRITIQVSTQEQAFDQNLPMYFYAYHYGWYNALLCNVMIPTYAVYFSLGEGAVGQGGAVGAGTPVSTAWYNVPAFNAGLSHLHITWAAGVAPTSGKLAMIIVRST